MIHQNTHKHKPIIPSNHLLIEILEESIMSGDAGAYKIEMLKAEKLIALKEVGWNPSTKISENRKGPYIYYKMSIPYQKSSKDIGVLIDAAYTHYFENSINITVEECFEAQLKIFDLLCAKGKKSPETAKIYRDNFRKYYLDYPNNLIQKAKIAGTTFTPIINEPLGKKPIKSLKKGQIHAYFVAITTDFDLSSSGLRDARTPLSMAFVYASNNDVVDYNLVSSINISDIDCREVEKTLVAYKSDELQKLLDVMTDEKVLNSFRKSSLAREAAAALCFETQLSIRGGETRSLRFEDVKSDENNNSAILVHSFIRRTRDKDGKRQHVYRGLTKAKSRKGDRQPGLSDFALSIVQSQYERHPFSEFIFCNANGQPLSENCLAQWLKRFCDIAGVEYRRPHCLRATSITTMLNASIPKTVVQHSSGHLNPSMTDYYADYSAVPDITCAEANMIFPTPTDFMAI